MNLSSHEQACFTLVLNVYPQIPDDCSHNSHPSSMLVFTFPYTGNTGSARMGSSLDKRTETHSTLTLLFPYVVKLSVREVVGVYHRLLHRPVHRLPVQQALLFPGNDTFGCQPLSLLSDAAEFLGVGFLVGQDTGDRERERWLRKGGKKAT